MSFLEALPIYDKDKIRELIQSKTEIKFGDIRLSNTGTSLFVSTQFRKCCETKDEAIKYLDKQLKRSGITVKLMQYDDKLGKRINCLERHVTPEVIGNWLDSNNHVMAMDAPIDSTSNFLLGVNGHTKTLGHGFKFKDDMLYKSSVCTIPIDFYSTENSIIVVQTLATGLFLDYPQKESEMVSTHKTHTILSGYLNGDLSNIVLCYMYKIIMAIE